MSYPDNMITIVCLFVCFVNDLFHVPFILCWKAEKKKDYFLGQRKPEITPFLNSLGLILYCINRSNFPLAMSIEQRSIKNTGEFVGALFASIL